MRRTLAVAAALLAPGLAAQPVLHTTSCTLYDRGGVAESGPVLDVHMAEATAEGAAATRVVSQGSATFLVDYTGFTAQARAAFQRAVDIWSVHLTSSVPIRVKADFAALGSTTLGSAGPTLTRDFANRPRAATWYPFALADALAGRDLFPPNGAEPNYDITAQFSSSRTDWYFGLDGNPPPGTFDFVTIVLHELGHGLGFVGSGIVDNGSGSNECNGTSGQGCWGYFDGSFFSFPFIYDRVIEDANRIAMLDANVYPNASLSLGTLLRSGALFMNTPGVVRLLGERPRVWAPTPFDEGSSFSHWDETDFQASPRALMTPQVARREAYDSPGDITCAYLADIGWPLGEGCQSLTTADEGRPDATGLGVSLAGPNPFRTATQVRIVRAGPGPLRVTLVDALGREVAQLLDGPAGADVTLRVAPPSAASGVYRLVAEAEGSVRTLALTHVR